MRRTDNPYRETLPDNANEGKTMETNSGLQQSRRNFVRKAAYLAPAIITLKAIPSFASAGSGYRESRPNRPLPPRVRQRIRRYLQQHPRIRLRRVREHNLSHLRFRREHD